MSRIRIGDTVTWESHSGGVTRQKRGVVAAQVPAGDYPINFYRARGTRTASKLIGTYPDRVFRVAQQELSFSPEDLSFKPLSDGGPRSETSFLVVADNGGVYWPYRSLLQKED